MKLKLYAFAVLLICMANFALAETVRGEIVIDWINDHKFEISDDDPKISLEIINRSTSEEVDNVIDVNRINDSNYNDYDRIIRVDFDAEETFTCSKGQIENISLTIDRMINHCANYQNWINGTVQYADKAAEWMAEAARLKEEIRGVREDLGTASSNYNKTSIQLNSCLTDKQTYYDDWKGCDMERDNCSQDLSSAKDSFVSKYLLGAIIGGIAVFLFTRQDKQVAEEAEEFEEVEY